MISLSLTLSLLSLLNSFHILVVREKWWLVIKVNQDVVDFRSHEEYSLLGDGWQPKTQVSDIKINTCPAERDIVYRILL